MIKKYYLSEVIQLCDNCNSVDIKTYGIYEKSNDNNYYLKERHKECQNCGYDTIIKGEQR